MWCIVHIFHDSYYWEVCVLCNTTCFSQLYICMSDRPSGESGDSPNGRSNSGRPVSHLMETSFTGRLRFESACAQLPGRSKIIQEMGGMGRLLCKLEQLTMFCLHFVYLFSKEIKKQQALQANVTKCQNITQMCRPPIALSDGQQPRCRLIDR